MLQFALGILISIFSVQAVAQSTSSDKKIRHWVFYGGVGPNIYFNNLVLGKDQASNELNYSFVGRIMWGPEHRLSIGFESGYNRLYTIHTDPMFTLLMVPFLFPVSCVHGNS